MTPWAPATPEEERRWLAAPAGPAGPVPIGTAGIAEVKPHTASGVRAGLRQLRRRAGAGTRVLVTYVPLDAAGRTARTGRADAVAVQAMAFADDAALARGVTGRAWTHLGTEALPERIPFPRVDDGGLFGSVVEPRVRALFDRTVVRAAGRTPRTGTGGSAPGPDAGWDELGAFYSELAAEVGDAWLAELGTALAAV